MKNNLRILLLMVIGLAAGKFSNATHAVGTDLTYECLGSNQYRVTLKFYRDCSGLSAPVTPAVHIYSASCSQNITIGLTLTSTTEISPICPAQMANSSCNGGPLQGIQQYIYQGVVTLPAQCSDWVMSYTECCRNNSITNSVNPGIYNLYVQARLNNTGGLCNNSPVFTTNPVPYICANQLFNYNHGATDVDGDSLVYSLVDPMSDSLTLVPYTTGFSSSTPISTTGAFGFNTQTGQMSYTPNMQQIGIVAVLVREYRNGVLIGSVVRDMQVVVLNCTNQYPVISNPASVTGGSYSGGVFNVCVGNTLNFQLTITDPNAVDIITVTNNLAASLPGATITTSGTNPVTANFSWTPTLADFGTRSFTVNARDNACTYYGQAIAGYLVRVAGVDAVSNDTMICPGVSEAIQLNATLSGMTAGGTYSWSPATNLNSTTIANPIATVSQPTFYVLSYTAGGCTARDTIRIIGQATLVVTPPSATYCIGQNVAVSATYRNIAPAGAGACNTNASTCVGPQSYKIVGAGTVYTNSGSSSATPFNGYWTEGRMNIVYTASSLIAAGVEPGLLSEIAFCVGQKYSNKPYQNFSIKLGCSNLGSLSSFQSGLTTVYSNASYNTITGWNNFVLPTAYQWDGVSSLIVEVCWDNGTSNYSNSDPVTYVTTSYNSVYQAYGDNGNGCSLATGTTSTRRPNIRFRNCTLTVPTYTWSPTTNISSSTSANPVLSPTTTTTYTVTATDGSCPLTASVVVNVNNCVALTLSETHVDVACFGGITGSIDLSVAGGTPGYTYNWGGGITSQDRTGLPTGTYRVTVTDAASATATLSVFISQPTTSISTSAVVTNVSCSGGNNGLIDLTVLGGVGPYTYNWAGGITTEDRAGLTGGVYSVTVTDSRGCTATRNVNVTQPAGVISLSTTPTPVSCNGGSNGAITLNITGGNSPFQYNWSGGVNTQNRTNLSAGPYTVTVIDNTGCTASASSNISQPTAMFISNAVVQPTCNGNSNGSINITVSGGTPGYTYAWNDGTLTEDRSGIPAGTYTVTVSDSRSCTTTTSVTVGQPNSISIIMTPIQVSCFGGTNGAINITVGGGTSPYTYNWGGGVFTQNRTGLTAGTYTVTVTDFKNCTASNTATVLEPLQLVTSTTPTPLACSGGASGSISTAVTGGSPPYSYFWGSGITTPNRPNIPAGNYTVTVTDSRGCTDTASVSIAAYTPISLSSTQINPTCTVAGSINITVNNGLGPFAFSWNDGTTTEDRSGLGTGTYSVTVTDYNTCTASRAINLTQAGGMSVNSSTANVSCFGGNNGSISPTVTGGTAPYTFNWGGGVTSQNRTGLVAGPYTVTITDFNLCTVTSTFNIIQPAVISLSATPTNVSCAGGNNGSISGTISGGTAPFTYIWNDGATTLNRTTLSAGPYVLTATDNRGCTATVSAAVTAPTGISAVITPTNISCFGLTDGSINLAVSGGTSPYTFVWNGGSTSQNRTGLSAGNYSVTITDNTSCSFTTSTTISQPAAITVSSVVTNVSCFGGNNGAIAITVTGGTIPNSFNWGGGITSQNRSNLTMGSYTVTVTDSRNCTASLSSTVNQNTTVTVSPAVTNVSCNGGNNGAVNLTVNGGTSPYTYNWGGGVTSQNRTNLTVGPYQVTVTDNLNCTATATATVTQPTAIAVSSTTTDVACNGGNNGSINLTISGGASPYTFNWGGGITTQNRTNLTSGSYSVTVTDNTSCTAVHSAIINETSTLLVTATPANVSCNGGNNGSINVVVSGGSTPYSYNWGGGIVTQNRTSLLAANYTLTVTDNAGCQRIVTTAVTQPNAIAITPAVTHVTCNGASNGAINITVAGGTPNYTYSWNGGVTSQNRTSIPAGAYLLTVTDNNTCTASANIAVNQPSALSLSAVPTNALCFGQASGSINLNVSGGTSGYTYLWSNSMVVRNITNLAAGNYTVTVTDANSCTTTLTTTVGQAPQLSASATVVNALCFGGNSGSIDLAVSGGSLPFTYNWSNSATTEDISGLSSGTYSVTVRDVNSCSTSSSSSVNQPLSISVNPSVTSVSCNGGSNGSINLSVNGGTGAYTYSWSNSATTSSILGLTAATYSVTVRDANLCSASATATVTQPANLSVSETHTNVSCNGGNNATITTTVNGGTSPFTYLWNDGNTNANRNALTSNSYSVTVTDARSCTAAVAINVTEPTAITLSHTAIDATCFNASNGSINMNVSGGTSPYTFLWNNTGTVQNPTNLAAGSYVITVSDAHACTASRTAVVSQPTSINIVLAKQDNNCYGQSNGIVTSTVTGGNSASYTYNWSNGTFNPGISGLVAGNYTLTVTDASGCTAAATTSILQPYQINLFITQSNVVCNGAATGAIDLTTVGGTPSYTFVWSNGAVTEDISGVNAGNYRVTVTDANACSAQLSASISQPNAINATYTQTNVQCNGGNNGAIDVSVNGGSFPYVYIWSTGSTQQDLTNLGAGPYSLTITDANQCTVSLSTIISQSGNLSLTLTANDATCNGLNNGSVTSVTTGGNLPYTYLWSVAGSSPDLNNVTAGNYSLTVTDMQGCSLSSSATVNQPGAVTISETHINVSCFGGSNGAINITANGGANAFSYLWSNAATTEDLSNLIAGSYIVTVSDINSCSAIQTIAITSPSQIVLTETHQDYACAGIKEGSINLSLAGGTTPFGFVWNDGIVTEDRNNILAGQYTVTATDAATCTASFSVSIAQIPAMNTSATKTDILCNGANTGAIDLTVNGGTTPYRFAWTGGFATEDLSSVIAGTYSVVVSDANNCTAQNSATISQPSAIVVQPIATPVTCNGNSNGSIDITVAGGVPSFTFVWNNGALTEDISSVVAGNYSVTVTDANNCSLSVSNISVAEPTAISVTGNSVDVACVASNTNGAITTVVSGGTSPYQYSWSNTSSTPNLTSVASGTYQVTVNDSRGCTAVQSYSVGFAAPPTIASIPQNTSCPGVNNGAIDITANSGTPSYQYIWNTGAATEDITQLSQGNYTVTVTDARGCTVSAAFNLTYDYILTVDAGPSITIGLGTSTTLNATLNVSNNPTFEWVPGFGVSCTSCQTTDANPPRNTLYTVNVTDANGCRATDTVGINVKDITNVFVPNVFTPNGDGNNDVVQIFGDLTAIHLMEFSVFNRWGEMVFKSYDHYFEWDGTYKGEPQNPGVFIYTMKVTFINGVTRDYKGSVTLVR
jgi:gliding motility-associated-like protein